MPNLPISGLPGGSLPLLGGEPLAIVQGGVTVRVPVSAFGQVVGSLSPGTLAADVALTTLYVPTAQDALVLVVMQAATVVVDPGAGEMDGFLSYVDQGGVSTSDFGSLVLDVAGRTSEFLVVFVKKNTALQFRFRVAGVFGVATYAVSVGVLRLF